MLHPAKITTIFFDLDNTLFDHGKAERQTLRTLHAALPALRHIDATTFLETYDEINTDLWRRMAQGEITGDELKPRRFQLTFEALGTTHPDYAELSRRYLTIYMQQICGVPHARDVLDALRPRYKLGILSNGFPDVQRRKLRNLDFTSHFAVTVFSGDVGAMKPSPEIFRAAEKLAGISRDEVLYVGDSHESDVLGAKGAGWPVVFFNRYEKEGLNGVADAEIQDLRQLLRVLDVEA